MPTVYFSTVKSPISSSVLLLLLGLAIVLPVQAQSTIADACSAYPVKPTPQTTGITNADILTEYAGPHRIEQHDVVIENKIINGSLKIDGANNVVIRNSIIHGQGAFYALDITGNSQNVLIEDVEITDAKSAIVYIHEGSGGTLRRVHLHESEGDAMKTTGAQEVLVEASYFAPTIGSAEGAHADGNQTRSGGNNITFRGNNIDMPVPEKGGPGEPYKSNANFIIQADAGNISNFHIACNWLNGGNYTVYFIQDKNNMGYVNESPKLLYNRFGREYRFGVLRIEDSVPNPEVCGNVWEDTNELMDINTTDACTDGITGTGVADQVTSTTELGVGFPNPFRTDTQIPYELAETGHVRIQVFNQLGQTVRVLVDTVHPPGRYMTNWDGKDSMGIQVASGLYFFKMDSKDTSQITSSMYLK